MKSFIAVSLAMASAASARTLTVFNGCPFVSEYIQLLSWVVANVGNSVVSISTFFSWAAAHDLHRPALFTSAGGRPSQATGWQAAPFTSVTFDVPSNWNGRIWGRRNCNFSSNPGPNSCLDGGCNGGLLCDVNTGTGVPPATLAEFNLNGDGVNDFYDVSLVDGYNLPMRIDNNVGCGIASCPVDLGPNCPSQLKGPFDSTGFPVGCKSACLVDALNGNAGNSANCCSGSHNTPATCPNSGVFGYSYFKSNCPNAYAYAFDESSGTALWECPSARQATYTISFCPAP